MGSQFTPTSNIRGQSTPHSCLQRTPLAAIVVGSMCHRAGKAEGKGQYLDYPCNRLCLLFGFAPVMIIISYTIEECTNLPSRVTLHFEGVNNAFYAWLNGTLLGYSQDSCLPAEFDVDGILRPGRNLLAIQVRAIISHGGMYAASQPVYFAMSAE